MSQQANRMKPTWTQIIHQSWRTTNKKVERSSPVTASYIILSQINIPLSTQE